MLTISSLLESVKAAKDSGTGIYKGPLDRLLDRSSTTTSSQSNIDHTKNYLLPPDIHIVNSECQTASTFSIANAAISKRALLLSTRTSSPSAAMMVNFLMPLATSNPASSYGNQDVLKVSSFFLSSHVR